MTEATAKQVHILLLKTFKGKPRKGYNWLLAKFGNTDLKNIDEKTGRNMLACIKAKGSLKPCPLHRRLHDLYI